MRTVEVPGAALCDALGFDMDFSLLASRLECPQSDHPLYVKSLSKMRCGQVVFDSPCKILLYKEV